MSSDRSTPPPALLDDSPIGKLVQQAASMFAREAARLGAPPFAEAGGATALPERGLVAPLDAAMPSMPALSSGGPLRPAPAPGSLGPVDPEKLRRQATEFVESLLAAVSALPPKRVDQAPLLRCVAPVAAGEVARATFRIANDGGDTNDVSLYCSNFVADNGYDIPSVRITVAPRRASIPPRGEVAFEIAIAVPPQTPRGAYSGLLQATGAQYAKAILTVEVT
jgi:hypothetical protein